MKLPPDLRARGLAFAAAALLAACSSGAGDRAPPPLAAAAPKPGDTTATQASGAAVTRRPVEPPAVEPAQLPSPVVVPANALYVCVVREGAAMRQTAIEFSPKIEALCRKHPEMGPCQYERNACRASGGRVFAANGAEITMATEAEYDRKVMRVRLRSN